MPTFDIVVRSKAGTHLHQYPGATAEQVVAIVEFYKNHDTLPEPVARRKKAPVKPAKVKAQ